MHLFESLKELFQDLDSFSFSINLALYDQFLNKTHG